MHLPYLSKTLLLSTSLLLLTACGGGGGSTPNVKEIAIDNIEAYADNNSRTAPTLEDYTNAGVQGVTADNIDDVNALVDGLTAEDVDSTEEIKALVASLGVNLIPTANAQSVTLNEDSTKLITLTGTDLDGDALTYRLVTQVAHGTLSGTAPNLTYTPTANYFGSDSFSFTVNDGEADATTATVTISVTSVKDAPVVNAGADNSVQVNQSIDLVATVTDIEQNIESYEWKIGTTLLGTALALTYTPAIVGTDVLTFTAIDRDGVRTSDTVNVNVTAEPNVAPTANAQTLTFEEDTTANAITLTGTDADGDALTYTVVTQPTDGTLGGTAPNLTYTPTADYFGSDSFTFKVNDGTVDSEIVTVGISITDVAEPNVAPTANAQTLTFEEDTTANAITLTGTDADGDALTYEIVTPPTHGTLGGTAPNMTYTPTADYFGDDGFTFKVNDGTVDSEIVTVGITVTDVAETSTMAVKKTGQLLSYNEDGDEVADGSIKDDGFYQKGVEPSYTRDDATEIVEDHLTGLMWQDDSAVATVTKQWLTDDNYDICDDNRSDPACFDTTGDTATTYCSNLTLGTYTDWRLPTVVELQGIVVDGKYNPSIDTTAFVNYSTSYYYWSSTTYAGYTGVAWLVDFYGGDTGYDYKSGNAYVRCVRAGQ